MGKKNKYAKDGTGAAGGKPQQQAPQQQQQAPPHQAQRSAPAPAESGPSGNTGAGDSQKKQQPQKQPQGQAKMENQPQQPQQKSASTWGTQQQSPSGTQHGAVPKQPQVSWRQQALQPIQEQSQHQSRWQQHGQQQGQQRPQQQGQQQLQQQGQQRPQQQGQHQQSGWQQQGLQQRSQQQQGQQQKSQQQLGQLQRSQQQQGSQQQLGQLQRSQQPQGQQQRPQQQQQSQQQQEWQQQGQQQQQGWPQLGQLQRSQQPQGQQQRPQQQQQSQQQQEWQQQGQQQQQGWPQLGQQQRSQQQQGQQQGSQQQLGQLQRSQQPQGQQQRPQQQQRSQQQQGQQQGSQQQLGQLQRSQQPQGQQQRPQQQQRTQQQQEWQQQGKRGQQQQQGWQQQGQQRPQQQGQQQRPQQQGQQQRPQQQQGASSQQLSHTSSTSLASTTSSTSLASTRSGISRGTIGITGTVETNYLRINLDRMPDVAYHYDVTILPDRPKKFLRKAFDMFNFVHFRDTAMAFDGRKSFYTVKKLVKVPFQGEVELADSGSRKIKFTLTIQETESLEIDLKSLRNYHKERIFDKPMRALQCIEVVLASPCHGRGVRAGRSFFSKPDVFFDLTDGYEMWTGLYQAAILGDYPFLNVDISHKSFPTERSLIQHLQEVCGRNFDGKTLSDWIVDGLRKYLRMVNIRYMPPVCFGSFPRTYRVIDITKKSAAELTFEKDDDQKLITVQQYFRSRGYNIKYPGIQCLQVGSTAKTNYVPMELCEIPGGQAINKKDGPNQVQKMVRFAATSTNDRNKKIMCMLKNFDHNTDTKIQSFGLQINSNFMEVPMRLLPSPSIEYFSRDIVHPMNGSWRMSDRTKFLQTKLMPQGHKWAVICSKKGAFLHEAHKFASMLYAGAKKLNISLAEKPYLKEYSDVDKALSGLRYYDLIITVIPPTGTSYAEIKQKAELKYGVLTQCIKQQTIKAKLDHQLITNLLLKINAKLNGTNHKINQNSNVPLQNVMFLGADVTHPSPEQKEIPSVVGVAASHDQFGACYNMQYRLQQAAREDIEDMESILLQHLKVYFRHQKRYPDYIVYYRDGVSDGQFPIVRDIELRGIKSACTKLRIKPKLTCIIVVKRHHTRFFPTTVINPRDKFNNVPSGTVVDRVITHPNEVQFFMVSHQSIQGTAKPTRYNVIEDEAKHNIDMLQTLTYNLCHLFPRCNRVVSYPAPAYLAHLVAYRGRVYLEGKQTEFPDLRKEYERRLVNTNFMQRNPMYFV